MRLLHVLGVLIACFAFTSMLMLSFTKAYVRDEELATTTLVQREVARTPQVPPRTTEATVRISVVEKLIKVADERAERASIRQSQQHAQLMAALKEGPMPTTVKGAVTCETVTVKPRTRLTWLPSKSEQNEKMCSVKYPPATITMLKRTLELRGVRKVAILGNFKDCLHVLASIEEAILQVSSVLSPDNVFVSFLESGSSDASPQYLQNMSARLQLFGISNIISTGSSRTTVKWKSRVEGNRIEFLSKLRNAAMAAAFNSHPEGYFDKFFFVNDVFICGGDVLRLLAHDADISCGLDWEVNTPTVYDIWVLSEWDRSIFRSNDSGPIRNVFSCWNGGIASRASLWYNGMRFRRGMEELGRQDCSQSECSLWAMDAHTLGYHNILLDPTVQLGFSWKPYKQHFVDSSPEVKAAVVSPNVNSLRLNLRFIKYRCCELRGAGKYVNLNRCQVRRLETPGKVDCDQNATKCLRYVPSRWEQNWDWKPLLKKGI